MAALLAIVLVLGCAPAPATQAAPVFLRLTHPFEPPLPAGMREVVP